MPRLDPIDVLEVAYSLEGTNDDWLGRIVHAAAPGIDRGQGLVAFTSTVPAMLQGKFDAVASTVPGDPLPMLSSLNSSTPPELSASLVRTAWAFCSLSEHMATLAARTGSRAFAEAASFDIADAVCLYAQDGEGGIFDVTALSGKREHTTPKQRLLWARLATHLTAMLRLRRRFRPVENAVLTPDGRVAHAVQDARGADARELIVRAVRERERARGRLRRQEPDHALSIWQGLVDGRWSLVDRFESDGSRWIIAYPNAPEVPDPRRLTTLERRVVHYAARGAANKEIGYALGVSSSRIGVVLGSACKKLRVRRRSELAALENWRAAESVEVDGVRVDVLVDDPNDVFALELPLTQAERDVAKRVARGATDAEIAKARGTSTRTVSNQLAMLYKKLGVQSRSELAHALAKRLAKTAAKSGAK